MRHLRKPIAVMSLVFATFAGYHTAHAADQTFTIEMKNGVFSPANLEVPADQKIHLIVKNEESSQTEFESYKLDKEVKIEPGESTDVYVGPLATGEYPIFDDNNPDTTGKITAK